MPTEIAADAQRVYWISPAPAPNITASSRTPGVVTVLYQGAGRPRALALSDDSVLWIDEASGSVLRLAKTGGEPQTIATKQAQPLDLAIDDERVYWVNAGVGAVMAAPLGGGDAVAIATGQAGASKVAVDRAAVYWEAGGSIYRLPK